MKLLDPKVVMSRPSCNPTLKSKENTVEGGKKSPETESKKGYTTLSKNVGN